VLTNPARTLPVYLLTQPDRQRLRVEVSDYLLDPDSLAKLTQGLAHVVVMPRALGFQWTGLVGKPWSAFLGAVRTYQPGLDFDRDTPSGHPLAFAERIIFWRQNGLQAERAFEAFLVEQAYVHASRKRVDWGDCLFLTDAQTKQAEIARQQVQETHEWQQLCDAEVGALKAKIAELEKDCEQHSDLAVQAAKERDLFKDENARLRAANDSLRLALSAKTNQPSDVVLGIPVAASYQDLPEWAGRYLVGRLEFHPRTNRGLKDACYENLQLVCDALLLLANEYRSMRLGASGAKAAFEKRLGDLGLKCSGSISKQRAGEEDDTYFVNYPPGSNRSVFLEFHLAKGTSREPQRNLRIYFLWHEDTQQVVVGWLPSHLDTRIT